MNSISLFPTHGSNKGRKITLEEYLAFVADGRWQNLVDPVRALGYGSRAYDEAKHKLPIVTPSGYFKGQRAKAALTKHSGFIGLDIDPKDHPGVDLAAKRALVERDKFTLACVASVSGIGFLALVQIPTSNFPEWFEPAKDWVKAVEEVQVSYFEALRLYYLETFDLKVDPSCTDVSRARYVSYDNNLYYNQDALIWEGRATKQPKPKPPKIVRERPTVAGFGATVLQRAVKMVLDAVAGTKHTALRDAAHLCGGYIASGCLDEQEAYNGLYDAIASREDVASMDNAENLIKTGFSKGAESPILPPYVQKRIINYAGSNLSPSDVAVAIATEEGLDSDKITGLIGTLLEENSGVFWNVEYDERKGKNIVDIQRHKLIKWLVQQGFRVRANGKEAEFFQLANNIVKRVHPIHISRYTADYVGGLPLLVGDIEKTQIEEAVLRVVATLFSVDLLRTLPWLEGEFLRDTASSAYYYFRNCWVEVTAAGIAEKSYEDLPALIWDSQIKPHDFGLTDAASPFHQFMINVTAQDPERLLGLQRALGYLMHSYKDVANSRALILMDETASFGKSEGGTGKGLLLQSVEQMIPMVTLPGATFKFEDAFKFELVNPDTRVVFMDEWDAQRLPFKSIFQEITGNLIINRKHEQSFSIPFAESPKFAFGTNQVIVSEGSSHQRRKIEILIANFYNAANLPIDEFKHRFFLDWDAQQWNAFYNLALGWVADYLKNGVVLTEFAGLEDRIIAQKAGVVGKEFLELVGELKMAKDRIWAKDAWEDFIGSSGIEAKFFSLRKFNELMELAGFIKEKCQERGSLGMVNRYHQIFFTPPAPPIPDLGSSPEGDVTDLF
jgi:hypothetical protein